MIYYRDSIEHKSKLWYIQTKPKHYLLVRLFTVSDVKQPFNADWQMVERVEVQDVHEASDVEMRLIFNVLFSGLLEHGDL